MDKIKKTPKIFFGWWTVLACGIVGFLGVGFGSMGFSVLFKPIAADLHLDRAVTSIAAGMQSAIGGITSPLAGWASDKYGPRRIMLLGIIVMVIGCFAMYFVNSLWSFLFVWGILVGGGFYIGATIITDKAIINWFVKKSGIAVSIKFAIQALAGIALLPVIALLVANQGWRTTSVIAGIVIAVVCIPIIWFYVKPHRPEYYGLKPDGIEKFTEVNEPTNTKSRDIIGTETELTLKQMTKTSAFWLFIVMGYVTCFIAPMMNAHFVPFLTDRAIDPIQAASMMGLTQAVGIPARVITGFIIDRINVNYQRFVMAAGISVQVLGTVVFLAGNNTGAIYTWIILYSTGSGISQAVGLPLQARYFGRKAFGAMMGLTAALQLPVGLAAPTFIGWIYDTTGSYSNIITAMAIALAVTAVIACFLRSPKVQNQAISLKTT